MLRGAAGVSRPPFPPRPRRAQVQGRGPRSGLRPASRGLSSSLVSCMLTEPHLLAGTEIAAGLNAEERRCVAVLTVQPGQNLFIGRDEAYAVFLDWTTTWAEEQ